MQCHGGVEVAAQRCRDAELRVRRSSSAVTQEHGESVKVRRFLGGF